MYTKQKHKHGFFLPMKEYMIKNNVISTNENEKVKYESGETFHKNMTQIHL